LHTLDHSDGSVSLLLDDDSIFIDDLTHPAFIGKEDPAIVAASWRLLHEHGAKRIYLGHGLARQFWLPADLLL